MPDKTLQKLIVCYRIFININIYLYCHVLSKIYMRIEWSMMLRAFIIILRRQKYTTWACKVRKVLYKSGLGVVWEMQCVGDVNSFSKELKLRLVGCFKQDWHAALDSHDF